MNTNQGILPNSAWEFVNKFPKLTFLRDRIIIKMFYQFFSFRISRIWYKDHFVHIFQKLFFVFQKSTGCQKRYHNGGPMYQTICGFLFSATVCSEFLMGPTNKVIRFNFVSQKPIKCEYHRQKLDHNSPKLLIVFGGSCDLSMQ